MSQNKRPLLYVLVLLGGLLCVGELATAAPSAEKQLQKGIEAYRNNDPDKAMDYFVDVLMNGTTEQAARANNYIDAIHNKIGGIETPVEVDISFPDQPTQTIVDPANNLANYGTERLNTLATDGETAIQEAADQFGQTPQTLTEQIEARQLEGYLQAPADVPALPNVTENLEDNTAGQPQARNDAFSIGQPDALYADPLLDGAVAFEPDLMPEMYDPLTAQASSTASTFTDLSSDEAVQARHLYTTQKLQSMMQSVQTALKDTPGVHLYLREDGLPDALDVDNGVLFQGSSFRPEAGNTLNSIYELLALTQGAGYTLLPAGSYTDDVTLSSIRQAMALKSYLVKRGISQGKLTYNMGLVDEEVPTKFANLKGLSIVFDYDAKLPTRLLDNEAKQTDPLLSMAIVPPCHSIDRALGEAYAVDFSVLETTTALDNWMLQVVLHGRDGKYYVVRQLEGFAPVYHQILWNGRKGIIGPELPCGKYTLVLTAVDLKGNKQVLRRRVVVKCAEQASTQTGACQTGTCPAVEKSMPQTELSYQSARLWKKPGRKMRSQMRSAERVVTVVQDEQATLQASGSAQSTEENTYTHTKTVRNIVTTDTDPVETVSSQTVQEYEPLPTQNPYAEPAQAGANPYEMAYEEEYTAL